MIHIINPAVFLFFFSFFFSPKWFEREKWTELVHLFKYEMIKGMNLLMIIKLKQSKKVGIFHMIAH